jgi:hypothetical protein
MTLAFSGSAETQSSSTPDDQRVGDHHPADHAGEECGSRFGKIVRPSSGSNVVTIGEATGSRSLSGGGNATGLASTVSRATYSVAGEGGQTFSITVPTSFDMTRAGGSETVAVTLISTATAGTLNGALGSAGSANFGVGGSFAVSNTTATGSYTGTFDVTVAYN